MSTQIFLTKAYFFQKITIFHKISKLSYSDLIFRHFLWFSEFGEENKMWLKFNFTYYGTIPASDFAFFIAFIRQISNVLEFLMKSEFVAQHNNLTIFIDYVYFFAWNKSLCPRFINYTSYRSPRTYLNIN